MGTLFLAWAAFLVGSIPSGLLVTRLITGGDIRTIGSGNIGAANVARAAGAGAGIAVALLDVLKGIMPVLLARHAGLTPLELAVVALVAVLGHDFSLFLRFRGGKGVATSLGVMLVLAPPATLAAILTWVVVFLAFRYTSLASLVSLLLLQPYVALTGRPAAYVVLAWALFVLAALKHAANLVRLVRGTERRFGQRGVDGR